MHKGKVIGYSTALSCYGVEFKVREYGRQQVLKTKRKNVHAFVVCNYFHFAKDDYPVNSVEQIKYNPYKTDTFLYKDNPIYNAKMVILVDGKIYYEL
jgi:hypothetical protein